jgi:N-methylhydantoinase B
VKRDKSQIELGSGQAIAITTPGAGGYGPPQERAMDLVRKDLLEERISTKTANEIYGLE